MFYFKNKIEGFELISTISDKTKNFKSADEIFRVSFDKTKDIYKNYTLSQLHNEKIKVNLNIGMLSTTHNKLRDLFVEIFIVIIGVYVSLLTGSFFNGSKYILIMSICLGVICLLIGLFSFLNFILNQTDRVKKNIIIHNAIINALEELIEEKQEQQKQNKISNSKHSVKPRRKRK